MSIEIQEFRKHVYHAYSLVLISDALGSEKTVLHAMEDSRCQGKMEVRFVVVKLYARLRKFVFVLGLALVLVGIFSRSSLRPNWFVILH